MMNTDGTGGTNDDQQMVSMNDREIFIGRLTNYFGGNRDVAIRYDEAAYTRSGGKLAPYKHILQSLVQRNQQQRQQQQQQQQQQQVMINAQSQQQMYAQAQPTYAMPMQAAPTMMNIKQEPQISPSNMQTRMPTQTFPIQQAPQQIKQELMIPNIQQQQQMSQNLQAQQMPQSLQAPQMRPQQQLPPPPQYIQPSQQQTTVLPPQNNVNIPAQQRALVQHLQQSRQQHQPDSPNPSQIQPISGTNSSALPQPPPSSSSSGQDEILQHLLSSPNPPKVPLTPAQNAVQARLRNLNRNIRQTLPTTQSPSQPIQQQSSPMTPNSEPLIASNSTTSVPSPLPHPNVIQQPQQQQPVSGQSPLARYMMSQSPQNPLYRSQMSPMNMINYANSPTMAMIDDEIQFLIKFFSERLQLLIRIITRCQQEGPLDKITKYRQLHDQISAFLRNPSVEHIVIARRLKEHLDRLFTPQSIDPTVLSSSMPTNRPLNNGIFEQCQRTITDYFSKDSNLKYNISKRFLEPLSEVLNGVPHKTIRLDSDSKPHLNISTTNQSETILIQTIENELAHLTMNTFSYELKPYQQLISKRNKLKNSTAEEYELTCRFIQMNMPLVPALKLKVTVQYPYEPPEILSLNQIPVRLENSDGNLFFESISRNFVYFLLKLPTQHTVSDVLDIWRTAIENAYES